MAGGTITLFLEDFGEGLWEEVTFEVWPRLRQ
jgi:hypothetical protein